MRFRSPGLGEFEIVHDVPSSGRDFGRAIISPCAGATDCRGGNRSLKSTSIAVPTNRTGNPGTTSRPPSLLRVVKSSELRTLTMKRLVRSWAGREPSLEDFTTDTTASPLGEC